MRATNKRAKINNICLLANNYFKIAVAVPLDLFVDLRQEGDKNTRTLPPVQDYATHFQRTKINYRVINISLERDLKKKIGFDTNRIIIPVPVLQSNIDKFIETIKKQQKDFIVNEEIVPGKRQEYSELDRKIILLNNIKQSLSTGSINILANALVKEDTMSPEAVSHDLGHRSEFQSIIEGQLSKLAPAFLQDYQLVVEEKDGNLSSFYNSRPDLILEAIAFLVGENFSVVESISKDNLKKKEIFDTIPDFLTEYHFQGDALHRLKQKKLMGKDLYFIVSNGEVQPSLSLTPIPTREDGESLWKLECKDEDLPNLNMAFDQLFDLDQLCLQLKQELQRYVGTAITLW